MTEKIESHVAPEYRELHECYCRCLEVREALLAALKDSPAVRQNPLYGELLESYAGLAHGAAALMILIQQRVLADPVLSAVWRNALVSSRLGAPDAGT